MIIVNELIVDYIYILRDYEASSTARAQSAPPTPSRCPPSTSPAPRERRTIKDYYKYD